MKTNKYKLFKKILFLFVIASIAGSFSSCDVLAEKKEDQSGMMLALAAIAGSGGGITTPPEPPLILVNDSNIPVVTYDASSYTLTRNATMTAITPTLGGDAPTSCSAQPGLPAGMSISPTTCALSGAPTDIQESTMYVITATNTYGSGQTILNLTVQSPGIAIDSSVTTFSEKGGNGSIALALNTQPNGNVIITVSSSDTTEAKLSKDGGTTTSAAVNFTFTPSNWNTSQTVTPVGQTDSLVDGDQNVTITSMIDVASTTDTTGYATLAALTLLVTVNDDPLAGQSFSNSIDGFNFFKMVFVPKMSSFPMGINDESTASVANSFFISETEVTYELWNTVRLWGTSHGYTFGHEGIMGDGVSGSTVQYPVAQVTWRDAVVWSNALTELSNAENGTSLTPVYYTDAAFTTLQKNASDINCGATVNMTVGSCDNPYVEADANGFRLPTIIEWELAARYKTDSGNDGILSVLNVEYTPGSYASGGKYSALDGPGCILGFPLDVYQGDIYAVYDECDDGGVNDAAAAVKSKLPNALGLYDMSGNVWEWNYDLHPDQVAKPKQRVIRGGSWYSLSYQNKIGSFYEGQFQTYDQNNTVGFRVARTW
jgi:formylglycine-generating enzyme required for sulfatase activity